MNIILKSAYLDSIPKQCKDILPNKWNPKDKFPTLCVESDDLTVHYTGFGKSCRDAAAIRSDHGIPKQCSIFYFEIKVVSQGRDGYLGVGLMSKTSNLQRLPGWETDSFGYHADDGYAFGGTSSGRPYGPSYSTGDVIGCCLNRFRSSLFFTKNGVHLGHAFSNVKYDLYPCVGLQSAQECIKVNFGQETFAYDIDNYFLTEQQNLSRTIVSRPWPILSDVYGIAGSVDSSKVQFTHDQETKNTKRKHFAMDYVVSNQMKRIVQGYFVHHGYAETAQIFQKESMITLANFDDDNDENCCLITRREIQRSILSGQPSKAAQIIHSRFPALFRRTPTLFYRLFVQNFIESVQGKEAAWLDEKISTTIYGNHEESTEMEVDESSTLDIETPEEPDTLIVEQNGCDQTTEQSSGVTTLLLAKKIFKMTYNIFEKDALEHEHNILMDVFSVIAYENIHDFSKYNDLFNDRRRILLSIDVNNEILVEYSKLPRPPLETFIAHLEVLTDIVNDKIDGYGGMLSFNRWF